MIWESIIRGNESNRKVTIKNDSFIDAGGFHVMEVDLRETKREFLSPFVIITGRVRKDV